MSVIVTIKDKIHWRVNPETLWAAGFFALLTIIFTWPLPIYIRTHVIGPFCWG